MGLVGCRSRDLGDGSSPQEFVNRNLRGTDFDLGPRQYVLTFDDGPGADTARLVDFLEQRNIPAIFFVVGEKVRARPNVVKRIAARPDLFYVANHSMTHTDPLTSSTNFAIQEINNADKVILDVAQPAPVLKFMRPPYGSLVGSVARIEAINAFSPALAAYIGPVFWDVGGELTSKHSADWACWGSVTMDRCQQGYVQEMEDRGRGIVLLHDVTPQTVDMVTRPGGLVDTMQERGMTIVNMAPAARVAELARRFRAVPGQPGQPTDPDRVDRPILVAVSVGDEVDGKRVMSFTISSQKATQFEIGFDRAPGLKLTKSGPSTAFTFPFANPGNRVMSVLARYADGKFTEATHSFTIPAPVVVTAALGSGDGSSTALVAGAGPSGDQEGGERPADVAELSQCFDPAKLGRGRTFAMFSGAQNGAKDQASASVRRSQLTLIDQPLAIAPQTWLLRYELQDDGKAEETYQLAISSKTGCIVDGVRVRTVNKTVTESFIKGRFIDCANKVWRGEFITPQTQSNEAVLKTFAAGGTAAAQQATEAQPPAEATKEWFTFHADSNVSAEPLGAGPGASTGTVCNEHEGH
jgi:peptidoglycan/xylan/chitin deacetylase (PgdA/CDA1 family)